MPFRFCRSEARWCGINGGAFISFRVCKNARPLSLLLLQNEPLVCARVWNCSPRLEKAAPSHLAWRRGQTTSAAVETADRKAWCGKWSRKCFNLTRHPERRRFGVTEVGRAGEEPQGVFRPLGGGVRGHTAVFEQWQTAGAPPRFMKARSVGPLGSRSGVPCCSCLCQQSRSSYQGPIGPRSAPLLLPPMGKSPPEGLYSTALERRPFCLPPSTTLLNNRSLGSNPDPARAQAQPPLPIAKSFSRHVRRVSIRPCCQITAI